MKSIILLFFLLSTIIIHSQNFLSVDKEASFDEWILDLSSEQLTKLHSSVDSAIEQSGSMLMTSGQKYSFFMDVNYDGRIDLMQKGMMMGTEFYYFFAGTDSGFAKFSIIGGSLHKVSSPDGKNPMKVEVISYPCCGAIHMTYISYNPLINEDNEFVYEVDSLLYYFSEYINTKGDNFDLSGKKIECVEDSVHLLADPKEDSDILMSEGGYLGASYPKKAVGEIVAARDIDEQTWYFVIMQHEIPDYFNSVYYEPLSKDEHLAGWIRADQVKVLP